MSVVGHTRFSTTYTFGMVRIRSNKNVTRLLVVHFLGSHSLSTSATEQASECADHQLSESHMLFTFYN